MAMSEKVRVIDEPRDNAMSLPVAVNGPIVAGVDGTARGIPDDGTGRGIV